VDRREFLRWAGRAALGTAGLSALAAACTSGGRNVAPPTSPTAAGSPFDPGTATQAAWTAFGQSLDGQLFRPGDAGYPAAHQLFDPRFDRIHPAGVVGAASEADVQRSVNFARQHVMGFAARSGGHSYAGYSTSHGLVCDVGRLSHVSVNPAARTAIVGAGARTIDVYAAAAAKSMAFAAGSCATVGIAGVTLGGGQGVMGRKLGLTCDNLVSLRIVTADGAVLTASPNQHQDLFWACRGGGGGNFGVVTRFTFRVHPLTHLARFFYAWPWSQAAHVVAGWQGWAPTAPQELWSNCHLRYAAGSPSISVSGVYVGSQWALTTQLAKLKTAVGSAPSTDDVSTETYMDLMLLEAGCSGMTVDECHLPTQNPDGKLSRESQVARSDFFNAKLPPAGIQALLHSIESRGDNPQLAGGGGGVGLDAFGGAINSVAADATAFVHRNSKFLAQYTAHWADGASQQTIDANVAWLDAFHAAMKASASGFAYQNYIDPTLKDWEHAYYGTNFPRLKKVKGKFDPKNFFRFPQSIPVP